MARHPPPETASAPPVAAGKRAQETETHEGHQSNHPARREQDRARALVWWVLRQPFADLAEAAARDWLAYSRAEMTLRIRAADLLAQQAVTDLAHRLVLDALDEAGELAEGAALTHAHARKAVAE